MRALSTLVTCFMLSTCVHAQLTLNFSDYAAWQAGTDTFRSIASTLPGLSTGPNQDWQYAGFNYSSAYTESSASASNPMFPAATFKTPVTYDFGGGFSIDAVLWNGLTNSGVATYGQEITQRKAFSLSSLTFGPNDSLIFPVQSTIYSSPETQLKLPAFYGSSWTSVFTNKVDFILNLPDLGFSQAPGYKKTDVFRTDSVSGWGKMKVKLANGSTSAWINVLQVKTNFQYIDSYYASGAPVPDQYLDAVGLQQAQETYAYQVSYYRVGEVTPLAEIQYSDDTYTTASGSRIHTQRLSPATTSVEALEHSSVFGIYPNPIADRTINIVTNSEGDMAYQVIDAIGREYQRGKVRVANGMAQCYLDGELAPGVYCILLTSFGGVQYRLPFVKK